MKILVIRLSSIGDVILTTPVLASLKERYPDAQIDFVVMDRFKDALTANPRISNLILFDKNRYKGIAGLLKFAGELKKNRYDIVIDLHSKLRSWIIAKFCGGKTTLRYKKRGILKSLLIQMRIIKNKYDNTIIKKYYEPLKKLGVYYSGENIEYYFEEKDKVKLNGIVGEMGKFVVFAPGASKETKKWPKEYFAELGKMVISEYNHSIVLVGGKNEYDELEFIKGAIGDKCYNAAGKLNLKESAALLSQCMFAVTNDSGPFHLARGVGAVVFVIFGPTDPGMFEYSEKSILIYGNEPCSSCSLHGGEDCPDGHFNCMRNIKPEMLIKKIKETV